MSSSEEQNLSDIRADGHDTGVNVQAVRRVDTVKGVTLTKQDCYVRADPERAILWAKLGGTLPKDYIIPGTRITYVWDTVVVNGIQLTQQECFVRALLLGPTYRALNSK